MLEYINLKNLSTKAKLILAGGALVLTGGIVGCTAKQVSENSTAKNVENQVTTEDTQNDQVTQEEVTESIDYTKYYEQIDMVEENVANAINDGLANGLYQFELEDNETTKEQLAQGYLNYYLMINRDELNGITFDILNQEHDMNSIKMINDSMATEELFQSQAFISTEDKKLNYEYIFQNENDREIVQNIANLVATMHVASKDGDKAKLDEAAQKVLEIKEGLMKENSTYNFSNPMTLDLVLMYLDAADAYYDGKIINYDEDNAQIFNTSFVKCINGEYVSTMTDETLETLAIELGIENYSSREELLEKISYIDTSKVSEVSLRSNARSVSEAYLQSTIESTRDGEYNIEYAYENVIKAIAAKLDLSLHYIPESDWIEEYNSNPYSSNHYKEDKNLDSNKKKKITKKVKPEDVPEDQRVENTEEQLVDQNDDGKIDPNEKLDKDANPNYAEIKAKAANDAYAQAMADHKNNGGKAANMTKKNVGKEPSQSASDNEIYTYWYNVYYNKTVDSFANDEKKINHEATTEVTTRFEKTDNGTTEETVIEQGDIPNNKQEVTTETSTTESVKEESIGTTETTNFIPVDPNQPVEEETVIEEGFITSLIDNLKPEDLKAIRRYIYSTYAEAYQEGIKRGGRI